MAITILNKKEGGALVEIINSDITLSDEMAKTYTTVKCTSFTEFVAYCTTNSIDWETDYEPLIIKKTV